MTPSARTLYEIARLPQAQGHDGELRPVLGFGRSDRSRRLRTEGLAVLHAPDTKHLRCRPCRSLGDGKGSLRGGALGRGQDRDQADLSAERGHAGASRPGVAQDRRLDGAHGVSEATPGTECRPSWTTWICLTARIRLDGIFGNLRSEDTPLRHSLPRAQGDERIEYHPVDLQALVECALARAKCPLGRNADVIDAGLPWRCLDALDQLRHLPLECLGWPKEVGPEGDEQIAVVALGIRARTGKQSQRLHHQRKPETFVAAERQQRRVVPPLDSLVASPRGRARRLREVTLQAVRV